MTPVAIGLGSNLGDRLAHLQAAVCALNGVPGLGLRRASSVYETAPMYVTDQPAYLNAAILAECALGPLALLDALKHIEAEVGRTSAERYGPRVIDLDLLLFGALQLHSRRRERSLTVPHPRTPERRFVLQPLAEIDDSLVLPGLGSVGKLLTATSGQAGDVHRMDHAALSIHCDR